MHFSALFCWLALAQDPLEPAPATSFDRVLSIQIDEGDAILAGHGRAERVDYVAEFKGFLHLWTSPHELDLSLRVEKPSGELVAEDDDSGGGTTPYVRIPVAPGTEFALHVAAKSPAATCSLALHAIATPETGETVRAGKDGEAAGLGRLGALGQSGVTVRRARRLSSSR